MYQEKGSEMIDNIFMAAGLLYGESHLVRLTASGLLWKIREQTNRGRRNLAYRDTGLTVPVVSCVF